MDCINADSVIIYFKDGTRKEYSKSFYSSIYIKICYVPGFVIIEDQGASTHFPVDRIIEIRSLEKK